MSGIGTAEAIGIFSIESSLQSGEIILGNHAIRVEKHEILPSCMFHAIVSGNATALVALVEILNREAVGVGITHLLARQRRAVFHYHHLKVACTLCRKACKQVAHLIDAVIHRNYD